MMRDDAKKITAIRKLYANTFLADEVNTTLNQWGIEYTSMFDLVVAVGEDVAGDYPAKFKQLQKIYWSEDWGE